MRPPGRVSASAIGPVDGAIILIYLVAVVGLGVAAGFLRRQGGRGGEGGHYFLAGNTLAWPVIGLAMFAANISTVHLVSPFVTGTAARARLSQLVWSHFDAMFGRNPTGRHFSYDAPREIEG